MTAAVVPRREWSNLVAHRCYSSPKITLPVGVVEFVHALDIHR
jgi:hypothetical protein